MQPRIYPAQFMRRDLKPNSQNPTQMLICQSVQPQVFAEQTLIGVGSYADFKRQHELKQDELQNGSRQPMLPLMTKARKSAQSTSTKKQTATQGMMHTLKLNADLKRDVGHVRKSSRKAVSSTKMSYRQSARPTVNKKNPSILSAMVDSAQRTQESENGFSMSNIDIEKADDDSPPTSSVSINPSSRNQS